MRGHSVLSTLLSIRIYTVSLEFEKKNFEPESKIRITTEQVFEHANVSDKWLRIIFACLQFQG